MNTHPHPLDFKALRKGTWLETHALERATSLHCHDRRFSLAVAKLAQRIYEETGIPCRQENERLRLMSDEEIAPYALKRSSEAVRSIGRMSSYCGSIDRAALSDSQRRLADATEVGLAALAEVSRRELRRRKREIKKLSSGGGPPGLGSGG